LTLAVVSLKDTNGVEDNGKTRDQLEAALRRSEALGKAVLEPSRGAHVLATIEARVMSVWDFCAALPTAQRRRFVRTGRWFSESHRGIHIAPVQRRLPNR
jgi:hypothetical protein